MTLDEANYNLEPDNSSQIIETAEKYNLDTREKLEAEVKAQAQGEAPEKPEYTDLRLVRVPVDTVLSWLDRQAAITAEETSGAWEEYRDATQREIAELTAERDALKAKLETYGKVPDQDECKKQQLMESGDTREQLEADVRGAVHGAYAYEDYIPEDMIIGWLDRQAAITERECRKPNWDYCETCELIAECDELREALTAMELNQMYELYHRTCMDRDEWRSKYEALRYNKEKVWCDCDCCNWRDERERLTDEVESLKRANRIQAESFQAIEYELAQAKAAKHN